jgi:molybdopterin/thiamine biosynthesis adenylyltransferase
MALLRILDNTWDAVWSHMNSGPGEHFAFLLARLCVAPSGPVLIADDVLIVNDDQVTHTLTGWVMSTAALVSAVNRAHGCRKCLVEVHNHGGDRPRFSRCDRAGFEETVPYMLESLPGRPYAALVTGDTEVYGEIFDGATVHQIDRISIVGNRLEVIGGESYSRGTGLDHFSRQLHWLTTAGQRNLAALRVAIGGAGGTGSHAALALVYLGARDFVLIDDDLADSTSLHRLATSRAGDTGKSQVALAAAAIKAVAPDAQVQVMRARIQSPKALALVKSADLLVGCFDDDGPRLVWNELAVAYRVPYLDFGVGIRADADGRVTAAGGRIALVLPGSPCMRCMGEIDGAEARDSLRSVDDRAAQRALGYVEGVSVPEVAVYSLNASVVNVGMTELTVLLSRIRAPVLYIDYDVLGTARSIPGQWLGPVACARRTGCVVCAAAGLGDDLAIEHRYGGTRDAA